MIRTSIAWWSIAALGGVLTLNGLITSPAHAFPVDIYWSDDAGGRVRVLKAGTTEPIDFVTGLARPYGVALNNRDGYVYWTDFGTDKIQRRSVSGGPVDDLVVTGQTTPVDIDLDVEGEAMYWLDQGPNNIWRAGLDGANAQIVRKTIGNGLLSPSRLELDLLNGKMYWTDIEQDTIARSDLDGSNAEVLVSAGNVDGFAIDPHVNKMYWSDNSPSGPRIRQSNLDGSMVETLPVAFGPKGASFALFGTQGRLLIADPQDDEITSLDLDTLAMSFVTEIPGEGLRTIEVAPIPEPASVVLLLAGVALMGWRRA